MDSIFTKISLPGIPVDLLATLRIFFEKGSLENKTLFEQLYIDRWFTYNLPQMDLNAEAIMATYKVRFMASLIGNDAATPLRPSDGFDVFKGEIPRMGHRFPMTAKKLRRLLGIVENGRYSDQQKFNEVYKILVTDTKEGYLGCKDTADHIVLQAFSNGGVAEFKPSLNNPDGRKFKVDYLMPAENKLKAAKNWNDENKGTINPFEELQDIKLKFESKGVAFGEMLMSPALYAWFISSPAVKKAILGNDKSGGVVTDTQLTEMLAQYSLPPVTKIVKHNAVQEDGFRKSELVSPWNENNIVFKPAGVVGEIQPAFEDNEIIPEPNVAYIDAGNGIRIAKWQVGESSGQQAGEYTQASWRALPIITDIGAIVNYQVRGIV